MTCRHEHRVEGRCTACGDCLHEVVLNGACFICGSTDLKVVPKAERVIPPDELVRKKPT